MSTLLLSHHHSFWSSTSVMPGSSPLNSQCNPSQKRGQHMGTFWPRRTEKHRGALGALRSCSANYIVLINFRPRKSHQRLPHPLNRTHKSHALLCHSNESVQICPLFLASLSTNPSKLESLSTRKDRSLAVTTSILGWRPFFCAKIVGKPRVFRDMWFLGLLPYIHFSFLHPRWWLLQPFCEVVTA